MLTTAVAPGAGVSVPRNKLLAALPPDVYRRLRPKLREVPLRWKDVLQRRGEPVRTIYFPTTGVCSVVLTMQDGRAVDVATVGNEGMIGFAGLVGGRETLSDVVVQVGTGEADAIDVEEFNEEMDRHEAFSRLLARYTQVVIETMMQSLACNTLHTVQERCARWLLMTHDRVAADDLRLTQEFLAIMLGARRASVSVAAAAFERDGLIEWRRRLVRIVDRAGLEAVSCECYDSSRRLLEHLVL